MRGGRRLIQEADYTNAGTVEFIVDKEGNYYFIEVNARIQVEHPVTEMVTGIDLIKQQILIAAGEPLPFQQEDIQQTGACHRVPHQRRGSRRKNFQPSPGKIERLIVPGGFGVRFDSHVYSGYVVPPYYDSMIGKLIVHQPTRGEAIRTMQRALCRAARRRDSHHRCRCIRKSSATPPLSKAASTRPSSSETFSFS